MRKQAGFGFGSDNEWSVHYTDRVVNVIRTDCVEESPTVARRHSTLIPRICEGCGREFLARRCEVKGGRGRNCSRSCKSRVALLRRHAETPQIGPLNPNWRGGRSLRPYNSYVKAFKAANPEKRRVHELVARSLAAGILVRPAQCSVCAVECRPEAHHDDYAQPLQVRWLCKRCHNIADRARGVA